MTLNELIAVYRKGTTPDDMGTIDDSRTLVAEMYAKVRPMSGSERNKGEQPEDYANYRFTIHQRSDLIPADVIVWNGTDYNIKFIADNGPKEPFMYIDAERGGAM